MGLQSLGIKVSGYRLSGSFNRELRYFARVWGWRLSWGSKAFGTTAMTSTI